MIIQNLYINYICVHIFQNLQAKNVVIYLYFYSSEIDLDLDLRMIESHTCLQGKVEVIFKHTVS